MSRIEIDEFIKNLNKDAVLLCLDVGTKTIGLATGNLTSYTGSSLKTIRRTKFSLDYKALNDVIEDFNITALVIGYPLNMDGTENRQCQSVRDFARELENRGLRLPYLFWDERLSTDSVDRYLDESVSKRKAKEKGIVDAFAAQLILERVLNVIQEKHIA
ncbi:MAG: Holliday junction resolvase RuvX [Alphaproteobacteria bacterium]|nr:Holliday junction resolvase RuvX [Alphaproteobacteria bacterium]